MYFFKSGVMFCDNDYFITAIMPTIGDKYFRYCIKNKETNELQQFEVETKNLFKSLPLVLMHLDNNDFPSETHCKIWRIK